MAIVCILPSGGLVLRTTALSPSEIGNVILGQFRPFGAEAFSGAQDGDLIPITLDGDGAIYVKVAGTVTTAGNNQTRPLGFFSGEPQDPFDEVFDFTEAQLAMSKWRALHVNLRDALTGLPAGTSGTPLYVVQQGAGSGDVTIGLISDALVAGDVAGTLSAKLRGINALLNAVINFGGNRMFVQIPDALPAGFNNLGFIRRDDRISTNSRRYQITLELSGSTSIGTNLGGLRKLSANEICRIKQIEVFIIRGAQGIGNPISFYRATSVSGGTLISAADIPVKDSDMGVATLQVRRGAVTGTKANQRFWCAGSSEVTTANQGGAHFIWQSLDVSGDLVLKGDEGIIIDQSPLAGDADDRYMVTIDWEEMV